MVRTYAFFPSALRRGWLVALLFGSSQAPVWAQSAALPADTSRRVLPTVQVQALRPARYAAGSRFTSLDSAALAPYRSSTVAEALSARTPLYLRTYGPGQLASMSIRGTAARHTAVLWHGFSLNFPSLGQADLNLLPVAAAARIDVQHGPAAAQYGTGAVGGAVVLGTAPVARGTQVAGLLEAGSFGALTLGLTGSDRTDRVSVRTSFQQRTAQNDYPYTVREFAGEVRRRQRNAALSQSSLTQDISVQLNPRAELFAAAWLTASDRQIQPALGIRDVHARQRDQSGRLVLGYRQRHARGETLVQAAWFGDAILYASDELATSHSYTQVRQAQAEHTFRPRPNLQVRAGAEGQQFVARVDGYGGRITEWRGAAFALLRYDPTARLRLTLNARQAFIPNRRPPLAPTLGAEWQLWRTAGQQLWLKANAARSYRAPTLNDRYWRPGGNPDLKPELGLGYEAGLHHETALNAAHTLLLQTELTAYRLVVDDWIEWPQDPLTGYYSPRNLRQVRTQGLEASSTLRWQLAAYQLSATGAYTFTQAQKTQGTPLDTDPVGRQLMYVPRHAAALNTDHRWRRWTLSTNASFTGVRFTDAAAVTELPAYAVLNASVGRELTAGRWQLTALLRGFNLTNQEYQNYAFHVMPPRAWALSLRAAWQ
ncbi:TonB-dependent receptor [Hymenobacter gummosus]|uniref:TonB-dependent receptor n=1 Tax=Hymenobacter gummosus TaxID=1776032 RepID=A0A3S0QKP3_9BACT|nr:TonB-dependent receptor [Hymenobacter gummosus]RTQ53252.1 TonB-dependent receptor [Hymenobacter gummosus]